MNNKVTIVTREELAAALKVDERKIMELEKKGMPMMKLGKKTQRYALETVIDWLNVSQQLTDEGKVK